jgi:hypothetical protein
MGKTIHRPTPTLLPRPACESTVYELFILLLEVSVASVLEEKEGKLEISHGGLLFVYVCVFGCFRVRYSILCGHLLEKLLYTNQPTLHLKGGFSV